MSALHSSWQHCTSGGALTADKPGVLLLKHKSCTPQGDLYAVPSLQVAFSAEGAPTKALEGFCKKNRITPEDVSRQADAKGVEYVWATVRQPGQSAAQVGTVQGRLVGTCTPKGPVCLTAQQTARRACCGLQR